MIERIMHANPSIENKKLEKDYQNHLNHKKNLLKSSPIPIESLLKRKNKMQEGVESQFLPAVETDQATSSERKQNKQQELNAGRSNSEKKTQRAIPDRNKLIGTNEGNERGGGPLDLTANGPKT